MRPLDNKLPFARYIIVVVWNTRTFCLLEMTLDIEVGMWCPSVPAWQLPSDFYRLPPCQCSVFLQCCSGNSGGWLHKQQFFQWQTAAYSRVCRYKWSKLFAKQNLLVNESNSQVTTLGEMRTCCLVHGKAQGLRPYLLPQSEI